MKKDRSNQAGQKDLGVPVCPGDLVVPSVQENQEAQDFQIYFLLKVLLAQEVLLGLEFQYQDFLYLP